MLIPYKTSRMQTQKYEIIVEYAQKRSAERSDSLSGLPAVDGAVPGWHPRLCQSARQLAAHHQPPTPKGAGEAALDARGLRGWQGGVMIILSRHFDRLRPERPRPVETASHSDMSRSWHNTKCGVGLKRVTLRPFDILTAGRSSGQNGELSRWLQFQGRVSHGGGSDTKSVQNYSQCILANLLPASVCP